ncbi:MAG: hypothetical protein HC933_16240 [Pleurocapsa sp. SU_196_0]|nr:hypothetical protein [Pleurocapsa sp. SU_196_0]
MKIPTRTAPIFPGPDLRNRLRKIENGVSTFCLETAVGAVARLTRTSRIGIGESGIGNRQWKRCSLETG